MSALRQFAARLNLPIKSLILVLALLQVAAATFSHILEDLRQRDTCGAAYISRSFGFEVEEHRLVTKDHYELVLHRLVHPRDHHVEARYRAPRKPYLLLHGLIGSSASFMRNVEHNFRAPREEFDLSHLYRELSSRQSVEKAWQSSADIWEATWAGEAGSSRIERLSTSAKLGLAPAISSARAHLIESDYYSDAINFGAHFRHAYRRFSLPNSAKRFVSQSLAFTLANFGYDVWLVNLRGNAYSRTHKARLSSDRAEFWDFDIQKLVKEDLLATINYVSSRTGFGHEPMGLVAYSYTNLAVLSLLSKFPTYQKRLEPVVMLAPAILTQSSDSKRHKFELLMRMVNNALISRNGPFPSVSRAEQNTKENIARLICKLPIAHCLCRLFETAFYGAVTVKSVVYETKKQALLRQDAACGQTSKAVLHEILDDLRYPTVQAKYTPYVQARNRQLAGELVRRSVMLIHSEADEIASMEVVRRIKDSALRSMTLLDYVITDPKFEHTDFLFSRRSQFLVNAEVARMVVTYDYLATQESANKPTNKDEIFGALSHPTYAQRPSTYVDGQKTYIDGPDTYVGGASTHVSGSRTHIMGAEAHGYRGHPERSGYRGEEYKSHHDGRHSYADAPGAHGHGSESYLGGSRTHVEGGRTHIEGGRTHIEGPRTHVEGPRTYVEGPKTYVGGPETHVGGPKTHVGGTYMGEHEGRSHHATRPSPYSGGSRSHGDGRETHSGYRDAYGYGTKNYGSESRNGYADDSRAYGHGSGGHVEGSRARVKEGGGHTHAGGGQTYVGAPKTYVEGPRTYIEGPKTYVEGPRTYVEGAKTYIEKPPSHIDGQRTHVVGTDYDDWSDHHHDKHSMQDRRHSRREESAPKYGHSRHEGDYRTKEGLPCKVGWHCYPVTVAHHDIISH